MSFATDMSVKRDLFERERDLMERERDLMERERDLMIVYWYLYSNHYTRSRSNGKGTRLSGKGKRPGKADSASKKI